MRRAPVPFVRKAPPRYAPNAPAGESTVRQPTPSVDVNSGAEAIKLGEHRGLDAKAAKSVVEADGYKRVTVLGRGPDGVWRVVGYRGNTEVVVTVDGAGTVTTE